MLTFPNVCILHPVFSEGEGKRIMRRTKEEAALTRKQILEAALDVFTERGYTLATFDDIARRIRLTKGAIYWHFKSKIDLLKEIIIEERKTNGDLFAWKPKADGSLYSIDDIRAHYRAIAQAILDSPTRQRFFIFAAFRIEWSPALCASLDAVLCENHLRDPKDGLILHLTALQAAGGIKPDVDFTGLAIIVMSIFTGTLKHVLTIDSSLDAVAIIDAGLASIFSAIASETTPKEKTPS